ncbi:MAG: hypothetical protein V4710_20610 [Verrucomicrobiota bacterium]
MRHARLLLKLTTGFLWALLVALVSGYLVWNEEWQDGFEAWRK